MDALLILSIVFKRWNGRFGSDSVLATKASINKLFLRDLDGLNAQVDEIFRLSGMEKSFDDS
ncbi:hypothetical protein PsorP6_011994 [Peronosclerospora sorghi]|uniref:Uncharacterized protein n=1 Tax=Peronosclerospora sorghi TaxID=230839 RepID=A0ACC0WKS5_9STRA|nr:hypothetical protein PsorP6_011994 [Peronosclerospora sorghi]